LNCEKKSRIWQKNATKTRHFQAKIAKIFWEEEEKKKKIYLPNESHIN